MKLVSGFICICLLASLFGCSNPSPDRITKILMDSGYSDIQLTGPRPLGCSEDDHYSDGFKAKGPTGRDVKGVVCSTVFGKGSTIRLY